MECFFCFVFIPVLILLYTDVKCHVELEQPKLLAKVASVASSGDADKVKSSEKQRCGLDLLFFLLIITCHLYIKDILLSFLDFSFNVTGSSNSLIIKGCKNGDFWWSARLCYG
jgi:hypothetical protein